MQFLKLENFSPLLSLTILLLLTIGEKHEVSGKQIFFDELTSYNNNGNPVAFSFLNKTQDQFPKKPKVPYFGGGLTSGSGPLIQNPQISISQSDQLKQDLSQPIEIRGDDLIWDCLWSSDCRSSDAFIYCEKGCRAISARIPTYYGEGNCFKNCCRCAQEVVNMLE